MNPISSVLLSVVHRVARYSQWIVFLISHADSDIAGSFDIDDGHKYFYAPFNFPYSLTL